MKNYFVKYSIKGVQVYYAPNCKSKAEAIRKVFDCEKYKECEAVTFEVTDVFPSTARAREDTTK